MRDETPSEEAALAGLLKAAGPRDEPPADFAREFKAQLHAEWRATVVKRQARTRWQWAGAMAASVAVAAVALGLWRAAPVEAPIAQVVQSSGGVQAVSQLSAGDLVTTAADGRLALAFTSGLSVRVAGDSELTIEAGDRISVVRGAVYVDAGPDSSNRPLVLATPFGDVRHVGTQYEVRVLDNALRVSVREGRIELRREDGALQGTAGERLLVSAAGNVERTSLAADAEDWAWASAIVPAFEIDNRPLTEFLVWAGRETGRDIVFASPSAQAQAAQIVLRGSVAGLTPDQSIDAVLATTTLRVERAPGEILIRD